MKKPGFLLITRRINNLFASQNPVYLSDVYNSIRFIKSCSKAAHESGTPFLLVSILIRLTKSQRVV